VTLTTPVSASKPASGQPPVSKVVTFRFCAATYIAAQAPGWKSGKHAKQWTSTIEQYANPVIGDLDVALVSNEHLLEILRPIWSTLTETATRLRGRIESILDWAKFKGYRSGDNPARWEENLRHELPSPTKLKKRKKQRPPAPPHTPLGAFMADLRQRRGVSIVALEWGILTTARSIEVRSARHSQIDLHLRRWTIPAQIMKAEKDHVVPLSDAAIALYKRLPVIEGRDWLFPAPGGGMLSDAAFGAIIDGMHEADVKAGGVGYLDPNSNRVATQHGFRSTFRDWAAEVVCFPSEIIEHALAHKLKDETEAAYQRGTMLMKRAVLMEEWAGFCSQRVPSLPTLEELGRLTKQHHADLPRKSRSRRVDA
jgi:integrase